MTHLIFGLLSFIGSRSNATSRRKALLALTEIRLFDVNVKSGLRFAYLPEKVWKIDK